MRPVPEVAPPRARSDLLPRTITATVLIVLALGAAAVGGPAFTVVAVVVVTLMWAEWTRMHHTATLWRFVGWAALIAALALAELEWPLVGAGVAAVGAIGIRTTTPRREKAGVGLLYAGLPGVAMVWLRDKPEGFAWVVWALTIVWLTDIMAYAVGRTVGGPKLTPHISPNKTWAGLGGGVGGAALVGMSAPLLGLPIAVPFGAMAGLVLGFLAQLGDLFESWLKRRAGIKDTGNLLPGHGGVLDRVDGLVPVAIAVAVLAASVAP